MKQFFNAAILCVIVLASCTTPFKKAKDGSQYKIISLRNGPKLVTGNYMELSVTAKYKDSILFSTSDEGMPQYGMYDTANFPEPFKEVFKNIHVGDSVVLRVPTDSLIKKSLQNQQRVPDYIKKGQFIYQYYVFLNAYASKEQVDSAQKVHIVAIQKKDSIFAIEQLAKDNKTIADYIAKNKITAVKGEKGTYVEILNPGTGNVADTSQVMLINYTGKTFEGVTFDSNTDSTFKHVDPYPVVMKSPEVIVGWIDGVKLLKKGAKARFYIPSGLAYGKRGSGDKIKANANLIFDISVVDIISQAQYTEIMKKKQEEQMAQQKMMQQLQQQMQQQQQNPRQQQH